MQFFETRMGAKFFNGDFPRLISAIEALTAKKVEYDIIPVEYIISSAKEGWRFVTQLQDGTCLMERRN